MDARLERIGRYAAVARGLEREGAYNAAKLLRAALQRELVRYAEQEGPSGGAAVADALGSLVSDLGAELAPGLEPLLRPLPDAIRAGHTIPLRDAPRVHVCRVCGETFLGDDVPATCPSCEAPALSFHEELPVWYLGPADRGAILGALVGGPRHLERALEGRTDEALARPPAPGEWSARQALEHLLFCRGAAREAHRPPAGRGGAGPGGCGGLGGHARVGRGHGRDGRAGLGHRRPDRGASACCGGAAGEPAGVFLGPRRDPSRVGPGHGALTGGVLRASRGVSPRPTGRGGGGTAAGPAGLTWPSGRAGGPALVWRA